MEKVGIAVLVPSPPTLPRRTQDPRWLPRGTQPSLQHSQETLSLMVLSTVR